MAATNIPINPPDRFDFKKPDEWPRWKRRFEQFKSASGLDKEEEGRQVSTLLYCLGEEAHDVLTSTSISEEDRKKYGKVMEKLDAHFDVRKNVIFERARFNQRNQLDGETAEEYITVLYSLVETCEFGTLKDEMIRDRLVVGIRDRNLAEKMRMDATLTLEKAKKEVRQREAAREQSRHLKVNDSNHGDVGELRKRRPPPRSRGGSSSHYQQRQRGKGDHKCTRCGRDRHKPGDRCPAKTAVCHKCKKKGHFSSQCFSKEVAATNHEEEAQQDAAFLGPVVAETKTTTWTNTLLVAGKKVQFKLDTGAEVTAVSENTYRRLGRVTLQRATRPLRGPAGQPLNVLGQFTNKITHPTTSVSSQETIYVVRGLKSDLLGFPAICNLQLLKRVDSIETTDEIRQRFANVFRGLGTLGEEYRIQVRDDVTPYSLFTPRNVPLPLRDKVKKELERMEAMGVISKVDQPTAWCAGMVIVPKKSGEVRICVDLKPLNESVLREVYPIPKVDDVLGKLAGATVYSKLDANSGFWQIPLAAESRLLTTFVTPFGRYCFNKLPFGISSAPELFQKRMSRLLEGLEGVVCLMDDVLIFGSNEREHDARLVKVFERVQSAGVTLNAEKCELRTSSLKFLGHWIDKDGVRADPDKTAAICQMKAPQSVSDLRRFMGMVNQMGKFSPNIAEIGKPLRELLSSKRAWIWGPEQERAFKALKEELTKPTVLALYDPKAKSKVSADASSFGLGAVLLQESDGGNWRPVAYASRSLSETERRYAQIEKEALATVWSCEKFSDYLLGSHFLVETDHKPLVPLLGSKHLSDLPPRVLRFRLRLARFNYTISHVPGKLLYTADTLSREPIQEKKSNPFEEEVETFVSSIVKSSIPATEKRLEMYRAAQKEDRICAQVRGFCKTGWPKRQLIPSEITPYWNVKDNLTVCDDLLLYNTRIVMPKSLQRETLQQIHAGHLGVAKCKRRMTSSVWWPGVTHQITQLVQSCQACAREIKPGSEPLIPTPLSKYPWQMVGTDLFELNKSNYLLVVDYFSRYPEVIKLGSTTSGSVISALKSIFSRHGIPEVVRSDNGPQYSSTEFSSFASSYGFQHVTSSPKYPQSNGQAERCVKTVKNLLRKSNDLCLALLSYRATPLSWCDFSPAELSMGRRLRTSLPQTDTMLTPQWPYLKKFRELNKARKEKEKENFDSRHRVKELPPLSEDTDVWVTNEGQQIRGRVVSPTDRPRSYIVETPTGRIERNRAHLQVIPNAGDAETDTEITTEPPREILTRSKTGTVINRPDRLAQHQ